MADINHVISLGIGSPASIPYFLRFGLGPSLYGVKYVHLHERPIAVTLDDRPIDSNLHERPIAVTLEERP